MNWKLILWKAKVYWKRIFPVPEITIASSMQMEGYTDFDIEEELAGHRRYRMKDLKALLLEAPDSQLDPIIKPLIEKWDDVPTALQILEVLDHVVYGALGSEFTVLLIQHMYEAALTAEGKTNAEVVKLATWRNK